jgi:hypothetical protein
MNIGIKWSALRETRWHEYLVRFALGGLVTAGTGAIANLFGPETGGVFSGISGDLWRKRDPDREARARAQGKAGPARRAARQGCGRPRCSGCGPGEPGPACFCGLGLGAGSPLAMACSAGGHRGLGRGVDVLVVRSALDMDVDLTSGCSLSLRTAKPAISSRAA